MLAAVPDSRGGHWPTADVLAVLSNSTPQPRHAAGPATVKVLSVRCSTKRLHLLGKYSQACLTVPEAELRGFPINTQCQRPRDSLAETDLILA